MTSENRRVDILVISAHPDDTEICCGGMILKAIGRGQSVGMIDLTRGEMSTRGTPELRRQEAEDAAKLLGVSFREILDFGDGLLRHGREEELILIDRIRKYRPSIVLAPWPDERHPDHVRTGRLVTDSWFYAGLAKLETDHPPHRPQAVVYYMQNYIQHPTFVVDITDVAEKKMEAIRAHRSQVYNPESNEPETIIAKKQFLDVIEGRERHFGALIGCEFGEGFVAKQPPEVEDLVSAYGGREVS